MKAGYGIDSNDQKCGEIKELKKIRFLLRVNGYQKLAFGQGG